MTSTRFHRATGAVLLLTAALAGCARGGSSQPERPAPTRTLMTLGSGPSIEIYTEPGQAAVTLPAGASRVWRALDDVYAQLEIPVSVRDPRTMEIGNAGYLARRIEGRRMNTYVDCGTSLSGPLANEFDMTIVVLTRLSARGDSTRVLTTMEAYGEPRATSGNQAPCRSREVLERRIAELTVEAVGGGEAGAR